MVNIKKYYFKIELYTYYVAHLDKNVSRNISKIFDKEKMTYYDCS